MNNNVLGKLKAGITDAQLSLVVEPIASTSFNLPAAGTDATGVTTGSVKTYGTPIEMIVLVDVVNETQAKFEIIKTSVRAPEVGGAFTYTVPAGGRGAEGSTAQAWSAGAKVYQSITAAMAAMSLQMATLRAQAMCIHARDGIMDWDGSNFKFTSFRIGAAGRGDHWSTDGLYTIAMPANGKTIVGYGGAANHVVASGVIVIPENTALFYELNINAPNTDADAGDRFRFVGATANFIVPSHWIMVAAHLVATAGDKGLRVCNGATLYPWRAIGAGGEPAFANSWVNFGGSQMVAGFMKDAAGFVHLRGSIKNGTSGLTAFTLPAGYRPQGSAGGDIAFCCIANGALGQLYVTGAGVVVPTAASTVIFNLDGVRYYAGL